VERDRPAHGPHRHRVERGGTGGRARPAPPVTGNSRAGADQPLQRAAETCELAGLAASAEPDDDLREWDYGDYEGLTTPEIRASRPGWTLWRDGCPNGETAAEVGLRADRVAARLAGVDGVAVAFAHGHLLRVLAARWCGLPPEAGAVLALDPATVSTLGCEREQRVIRRWNA
jgi:probable phosphoglycerate mutase